MCTKPSTAPTKKNEQGYYCDLERCCTFLQNIALSALFLSGYVEQVHTSINDYDDTSHFIVGAEGGGGGLVYVLYGKCTCNTFTSPDMYNNLASQKQHRDTHTNRHMNTTT